MQNESNGSFKIELDRAPAEQREPSIQSDDSRYLSITRTKEQKDAEAFSLGRQSESRGRKSDANSKSDTSKQIESPKDLPDPDEKFFSEQLEKSNQARKVEEHKDFEEDDLRVLAAYDDRNQMTKKIE